MTTYVRNSVCLQIYNASGDLIRILPINQAKKIYPELFDASGAGGNENALCTSFGEIKLNKSHQETDRECRTDG